MDGQTSLIPMERIERAILSIRGEKVMLDSDLAELNGVETKRLNEQVRRNPGRFPPDFMFQLTETEKSEVVANCDHLARLRVVFDAIRGLMSPPEPKRREIGFHVKYDDEKPKAKQRH
jgi:hypothetical protein